MLRRWGAFALILGFVLSSCEPGVSDERDLQPQAGGELVVAVRDLGSLDPARASGRGALLALDQIFDPLTAIDPVTNEVVAAAASEWSTSADGLTWVFTIASTFHDGTPVSANDFKFAFDRLAKKSTDAEAAFQLEQVKGFRESHTLGTASTLSGVSVRPGKLVITLERPYTELPYALAHPALGPISTKLYAKGTAGLNAEPVGNGPFAVERATLREEAVLVRNDAYTPTPFLDRVRLVVMPGTEDGWARFGRGEVDVTDVPTSSLATARGRYGDDGFTPQWSALSFGPNLKLSKYAKPEVRRALSLLVDREAIAAGIYGGTKDPATGILPRGIRGYVPDACSACAHDVARARQILDAAFQTKPSIAIDHLSDDASRQVSRAIANQLEEAGFTVTLRAHAPTAYLKVLQEGRHDLAQLGWIADVPTPDGFLAQQLRTGSPNNQTGFKDAAFDKLIELARRIKNEDARLKVYRDAEARALELMPLIPVVFFRNRTAVADRVHGLVVNGAGLFDASVVWLAS